MNHFATIITTNHIDKTLTVLESLNQFDSDVTLHVLLVDYDQHTIDKLQTTNLITYDLNELINQPNELLGKIIVGKYAQNSDELRWALKPLFILYLINQYDTLCYIDCDLYFCGNYQFIFNKLKTVPIILTPHWRQIHAYGVDYHYNYKHGIYNAGFIGFNKEAIEALQWWAALCARECTKSEDACTYTDQRYLDLVPTYFEKTEILRHYGCNVAGWNTRYLNRRRQGEDILVNEMPIIFIHFSQVTINMITDGEDNCLIDYYRQYKSILSKIRKKLIIKNLSNCISRETSDYLV